MDKLSVIGVEDDLLVVEAGDGARYAIDVAALPELPRPKAQHAQRKASPREIQAALRAGRSAEEIAAETGEDLEFVRRFEGPVVAERDHVLDQALRVAVASGDIDPLAKESTFGDALAARLQELGASDESWFAWREGAGSWVVRLRFHAQGIDHVATWTFEPRKAALTPRDKEATALSQRGDASTVLMPRLRAVDQQRQAPASEAVAAAPAPEAAGTPQSTTPQPRVEGERFDSGAFRIGEQGPSKPVTPSPALRDAAQGQPAAVVEAAVTTARPAQAPNHTADLLEALRRRRGEREAALRQAETGTVPDLPSASQETLFDAPEAAAKDEEQPGVHHTSPLSGARAKRGSRQSMPSWDEIVFGARGDDEPA
ncbi:septation protein SepH [Agrococcus sp. SGAir0287]|uniref:septation protein SepH n=1 Tax=Agrococcus sp. SGAir0287 TaxID=2070347 RepID=UPI001586BB26|nr:septation protein SepH [Agrococcus sp. SGAir0287]